MRKFVLALSVLLCGLTARAEQPPLQPSGGDDTAAIQTALNAGVTILGAGRFIVSLPIVVPKGAKVSGAGIGKTIIEMSPTRTGETRSAVILLSSNSSIENLTTISTEARCNGIVADSDEVATGMVENVSITSCEVRHRAAHAYGIWGRKVANLTIQRCIVDGGCTTLDNTIEQEGIELYGCYRSSVLNCVVSNCGRSGILLFHEAGVSSESIRVEDCRISNSSFGIVISVIDNQESYVTDVIIRNNIVTSTTFGDVAITSGTGAVISCVLEKNLYSSLFVNSQAKHLVVLHRR